MTERVEKLNGGSLDISAENRARLKALFPAVFTETRNAQGELVESVDFEKLKAELGTFTDLFENRRERYGMDWPGKKDALRLIQTPSYATLKPCRDESINFDTTENLFIEGDNLEVLKLLQKSYYGKVKMIYIDPPYNTGKEFIYPDNFTESPETYLEYAGLIDGEGKKFSTNTANEGRFHTKWLNMMYPRLYLARNLLRDDGVIFISIDDNEASNLRKMCDEIFGEENFVTSITRRTKVGGGSAAKQVAVEHDYVLVYLKNIASAKEFYAPYDSEYLKRFKEKDNIGPYYWDTFERSYTGTKPYKITAPDGAFLEGFWFKSEASFHDDISKGEIRFVSKKDKTWSVQIKTRPSEGRKIRSLLVDNDFKSSQDDLEQLGLGSIFDFPKPKKLVMELSSACTDENNIILDFFSGSATTAHAVFDLNKQDQCTRKFILVQLPEPCAADSEAFKAGYKTIADIGKERIRRVIKKLNEETQGSLNLDGAVKQDRGFKVLKLDQSNFKQWQKLAPDATSEQIQKQLEMHIDHVRHEATPEDLLYEILIKSGFMPTEKVRTITLAGIQVFSIANGGLLICLADTITKKLIDAVAEADPQQFVCLDAAFKGNDQLKANAVQTFNARNQGKEKHNQIVFKTV
jgi:adenine-specific DNA-methyltransferase